MLNYNESGLVEREREQIFLQGALDAHRRSSGHAPKVIFITGPEGSGRSALLTLVTQHARRSIQLAGCSFRWPQGEGGLGALSKLLGMDEASPLHPYLEIYRAQKARVVELERRVERTQLNLGLPDLKHLAWGADLDEDQYRAVQALPPKALHFLLRRLYNFYTPNQLSEQTAAFFKTGLEHIIQLNATNLSQLRVFVEQELRPQFTEEDWQFYLKPEETLARDLAYGINAYTDKERHLVLLFDDYHAVDNDRFLRQMIETTHNTIWIFATEPRPTWSENMAEVSELRLSLLTDYGVASYFEKKYGKALTAEEAAWLAELTGRTPLTLYIASDLYANGASATDLDAAVARVPNDRLAGLFLYFVEESGRLSDAERIQLYTLAILHQLNADFLPAFEKAVKAADYSYDSALTDQLFETYSWLADQVESAEELEFRRFHPALKEILRRYLMLERRRFSRPIQEGILQPARNAAMARLVACEQRLVADPQEQGSIRARATDPVWGEVVADLAYYRLWLDEAIGWVFLLPRWVMALAYNRTLAEHLLVVAESMEPTFYNEGVELLPVIRTLLKDSYSSGGRKSLEEKLAAVHKLETVGTTGRNRWFRLENLGLRPGGKGSAEAELKGILKWSQARIYEEAGQYEKAAPLYEDVLATNVEMPNLKQDAAHAALYLAMRYRLQNAMEMAYSSLYRAAELNDQQEDGLRALFWQSVRLERYDTALKAADALLDLGLDDNQAELFMIFSLYAFDRKAEALTEARTFAARPAPQTAGAQAEFHALVLFAGLPDDTPDLIAVLNELPA